jgi:colanic acid/amylovoran biosynthesis glycosyltransferase
MQRRVIVYRSELLPFSETFILAQTAAMQSYRPHFFGLRRVVGLDMDAYPQTVLTDRKSGGRWQELLFQYFGYAPKFVDAAATAGADLVHAHFAFDGAECLPLVKHTGKPLIVTLHGWDASVEDSELSRSRSGRRYLNRRRELQSSATLFLCVSDFIRRQALERGFPEHKLRVHYIGIDTAKLQPTAGQTNPNTFVFVGRLIEKKGVTYLLQAMARLQASHPESQLVVIGDGPLRARYETEARQLGVNCRFLGKQPNDVVQQWMRNSVAVCVPSVRAKSGDSEGLPTVIYEAFALGVPAVAFASAGIPEAVVPGTGLLAQERDVEGLATHLRLLLENASLRQAMGRAAREHVVRHFDLKSQTRKLEDLYAEVTHARVELGTAVGAA